ncbi:MAG: T9SS type A sorting domain-containing protein [Candidatus Marinimicrobia bacterium]|nr:T9SS type A sorting domain-containing protein [Candidatus Neomarinimicrobiota bacterium]
MLRKSVKIVFINLTLIAALWAQAEVLTINSPTSGESITTSDVTVSFTVASYFTMGDSGCGDCDGFVRAYLNDDLVYNASSTADFVISGVIDGNYFLTLEAVNPSGESFDPVIEDTVSFTVIGNPALCNPYNLMAYPGDGRNTLKWSEPEITGGIGCGDYIIDGLPYSTTGTNVDAGNDWFDFWGAGDDVAYTLNITSDITLDISLCGSNTDYDTYLYLFTGCPPEDSLIAFDDDGPFCDLDSAPYEPSLIEGIALTAGQYYVVVDGYNNGTGNFELIITESTMARQSYDFDATMTEAWEKMSNDNYTDSEIIDLLTRDETEFNYSREIDELCGTFVQYNVYDESDNSLVGSTDTTFFIHNNLTNDTEYCYFVRAEYAEGESANSDTACATPATFIPEPVSNLSAAALDEEVALSWTDPSIPSYIFYENFINGIPATWTIEDGGTSIDTWMSPDPNHSWSAFGDNLYVICDSDIAGPDYITLDEVLITPSMDFSNQMTPYLQFESYYRIGNYTGFAETDISIDGGSNWTNLIEWTSDQGSDISPFTAGVDLSNLAGGESNVKIRFHYSDAGDWAWYWALDNVRILDSSPTSSRWNDGDLTHYNIYQDGVLVEDSVEVTGYVATGLTNATTYTFSVSAAYYPNYESDTVSVSATPTWLYGDVTGTITDPNGTPLDSTIVSTGDFSDTTGSDGTYFLGGLDPGDHTIRATRSGFDWVEADVTVIAQDAAVTADIVLIPSLMVSNGLEATAGDETIHLIWNKPGTMSDVDLTGEWTLFYDWGCSGSPGNVDVEFTEDGGLLVYGDLIGGWVAENNSVDLSDDGGLCPAATFEYNAYFYFDYYTTVYYMYVEEDAFTGMITSGYGGHDGDNYGIRLTAAAMREVETFDEANIAGMVDLIIGAENVDENEDAARMIKKNGINQVFSNSSAFHARSSREDSLIGYNVYQLLTAGDTLVTTTTSGDDTTATITVPTNYVEYCYYVKARWNTDNYGILESKASDPACEVPFRSGDIDFNDAVDVSDLLACVDFILELDIPTEAEFRNADVNMDMEINIADVVMIVDIIVGGANARTIASTDVPVLVDLLNADQQLLISLDYEGLTRGIQFTLDADASLEFGSPLLTVSDNGTMVASNRAEDGTVTIVVVNTSGGTVERAEDVLVRIPYTFKGNRRDKAVVELKDLKAAGMAGEALPVTIREKRIDISVVPSVFALHQNYPNPFNPVTEIQFDVPVESKVKLTIYNIMGQEVTTLSNSTLEAGFHSVRWDGTNGLGEQVSTGVYFYRLSSPAFTSTKKMIMVK